MTYFLMFVGALLAATGAYVAGRVQGYRWGHALGLADAATARREQEDRAIEDAERAKRQRRSEGGRKAAITRKRNRADESIPGVP